MLAKKPHVALEDIFDPLVPWYDTTLSLRNAILLTMVTAIRLLLPLEGVIISDR